MIKLIIGYIRYLFYTKISLLAIVDARTYLTKKVRICRFAQIRFSQIDDYTYIGPSTRVLKAQIGKYCSIADSCIIGLPTHTLNMISTSPIFTLAKNGTGFQWIEKDIDTNFLQKVTIGNDVWVGTRVIIKGGCTIGDGAIIGAGAIVTKDVPPYAIMVGTPAKVLRYRFSPSVVASLLEAQWWNLSPVKLKQIITVFQIDSFTEDDVRRLLLKI